MKKRYIILIALIGLFFFQFFLVERTEYIAGQNRYYTFYEKYLDNEIDITSSTAFDNDIYNLERITNKITSNYDKTEIIRQNILRVYEKLESSSVTLENYIESVSELDEYKNEIQEISDDINLQKNHLKELSNYIIETENQTKSAYFYISDIEEYISRVIGLDTTLNNYSDVTTNLTSIVKNVIQETQQEQERRQRKKRLIQEQQQERLALRQREERLIREQQQRTQFVRFNENTNQSVSSFNDNYSTNFQNSSTSSRATSTVKYYTNTDGNRIQSPTSYNTQPSGATALCNDGTYSFSQNRRGTCSGHGGVRKWL